MFVDGEEDVCYLLPIFIHLETKKLVRSWKNLIYLGRSEQHILSWLCHFH